MSKRWLWWLAFSLGAVFLPGSSCSPKLPPNQGSGGFIVHTLYVPYGEHAENAEYVDFNMSWVQDGAGAGGDASPIKNQETDDLGLWASANGRAPAVWSFDWLPAGTFPACATAPDNGIQLGFGKAMETSVACYAPPGGSGGSLGDPPDYSLHPNPLNIPSPPSQVSVETTAGTFNSTYGLPVAQYFDEYGNLVEQQNATSISSNGSSPTSRPQTSTTSELARMWAS